MPGREVVGWWVVGMVNVVRSVVNHKCIVRKNTDIAVGQVTNRRLVSGLLGSKPYTWDMTYQWPVDT